MLSVYLDESGNSGRNYLTMQQPFYVLAGWVVDDEQADACRKLVIDWETPLRKRGVKEPKATSILRRAGGADDILALLSSLMDRGAVPTVCIFEKRFGICMNIAESFFGIMQHSSSPIEISQDALSRNELAAFLCGSLSNEVLALFAEAAYNRDESAFKDAKDMLREELYELGNHDLGFALDFVPIEASSGFAFLGKNADNSINVSVFHTQVMLIERLARQHNCTEWRVRHDNAPEFAETMRKAARLLASEPERELTLNNGLTIYFGKLRLAGIDFLESSSEPLIRAADYYAGILNSVFTRKTLGGFAGQSKTALQSLLGRSKSGPGSINFITLAPDTEVALARFIRC